MALSVPEPSPSTPPDEESRRMTFEEYHDWLDEDTWAEWVNGEIIRLSPASNSHQDLSDFLIALFRCFVEHYRQGWVRSAPFLMKLGQSYSGREPDLLYVSHEHIGRVQTTYLDGPADLVIEIVSLESRSRDRGEKYYEYELAGVQEYWLLDPLRKSAEFYVLDENGRYQLKNPEESGVYRSQVLSGLWIRVDWLWQDPLPPVASVLKEWKLI